MDMGLHNHGVSDPYVPQVGDMEEDGYTPLPGHLVKSTTHVGIWLVTGVINRPYAMGVALDYKVWLSSLDGQVQILAWTHHVAFLADRSAEWQALFQLDTPTP